MARITDRGGSVLVIGGGVAGARVAHDAAQAGLEVYLIEKSPTLGGIVGQLGHMFPNHNCLLCRGTPDHGYGCSRPSISPDFLDFARPENLHVHTLTRLASLAGDGTRGFTATIRTDPRYVDPTRCINCGRCAQACPAVNTPDASGAVAADILTPAARGPYKPGWRALPNAYLIAKGEYCRDCDRCAQACPTRCIDLNEQPATRELTVDAVVLATGYRLHDPSVSAELGYGRVPNVLTGYEFERMANPAGPTGGRIVRPSDGATPKRIAWLQCVGSRDRERDYCSAFCCMYATKQAVLARQALPDCDCSVFFMDDRVFAKHFLDTYEAKRLEYGIHYTRCRLYDLRGDAATGAVRFRRLTEGKGLEEDEFDLVVLSIGAEPAEETAALAAMTGVELNSFGFLRVDDLLPGATSQPGIFVAGSAASPRDICDAATDAAAVAAQVVAAARSRERKPHLSRALPSSRNQVEPQAEAEPRTGVFLCRCGQEIAGTIDVDALAAEARNWPGVAHARAIDFACLPEGQAEIDAAIRSHRLDRLVAGACTPRTHQPLFEGILSRAGCDPHALEFVGLREYCAWPHSDQPVAAGHKARAMLRRGVLRVASLEGPGNAAFETRAAAVVLGGGLSGMTAALHLADSGVHVELVEKAGSLGGNFARIRYLAGGLDPRPRLADLIDRTLAHPRIHVRLLSEIARVDGRPGDYRTVVRTGSAEQTIEHGALIVATGAREYRGAAYDLGTHPHVVTQLDLEAEVADHPERVAGWREIVMISCVGPWSEGRSEPWRCSRNCCQQIMKNALRIKELNADCRVVVLMRETMTTGFTESLYTEARRQGVLFIRYAEGDGRPAVHTNGQISVGIRDLSLGQEIEMTPDRVALAVALMPNDDNPRLARLTATELAPGGFFAETEPKGRPAEVHRPGVYVAGLAHGPKDSRLNGAQALAAAESAVRMLLPGAIEPRRQIASVDETRCMGCLTCVRVCPYGVPRIDSKREGKGGIMGASYIDPLACQGCGTCPSECPGKAITLKDYRDEQITISLGSWE